MREIAIFLSIISSLLLIVYLLMLIFGRKSPPKDDTITIQGRIVTRVVHTDEKGRVIDQS